MTKPIPDNIYPARGRKPRMCRFTLSDFTTNSFPTIFTPQGDGNSLFSIVICAMYIVFPTIFTPQGDGNTLVEAKSLTLNSYSRQYLPRKGTETLMNSQPVPIPSSLIPDNIYPARGRKLFFFKHNFSP